MEDEEDTETPQSEEEGDDEARDEGDVDAHHVLEDEEADGAHDGVLKDPFEDEDNDKGGDYEYGAEEEGAWISLGEEGGRL